MSKNNFKFGEWNVICDSCGFKYKSGQLRKRWDGFMVCPECFEVRHPQDFLRARLDRQDIPWSRPRPTDVFVQICDLASSSGYVGLGTIGCMQVGQTFGMTYDEILQGHVCSEEMRTGVAGVGYAGCMKPLYNADAYL